MVQVGVGNLTALHEPRNTELLECLADDMKEHGWNGRPLLVIKRRSDFLAWTGSHRIAAAKLAGLEYIPCYVLQESELTSRGFDAVFGHVEDYERLAVLRKIGDDVAIKLMWQENRT